MSLPETAVQTARCSKCDAEIRDGSAFCYNCGGRVADDEVERSIENPNVSENPSSKPAPGLRTARDIRRRERGHERKPKQVAWIPDGKGPDLQLVIVTTVIIVFTLAVILLVRYLG